MRFRWIPRFHTFVDFTSQAYTHSAWLSISLPHPRRYILQFETPLCSRLLSSAGLALPSFPSVMGTIFSRRPCLAILFCDGCYFPPQALPCQPSLCVGFYFHPQALHSYPRRPMWLPGVSFFWIQFTHLVPASDLDSHPDQPSMLLLSVVIWSHTDRWASWLEWSHATDKYACLFWMSEQSSAGKKIWAHDLDTSEQGEDSWSVWLGRTMLMALQRALSCSQGWANLCSCGAAL